MDVNYKLIMPDGSETTASTIHWVTWNQDGGGLKAAHNGPELGRSLVMDMKTIPLDMLMSLVESKFEGIKHLRTKSAYSYLSKPIVSVDETVRDPKLETIKFTTEDGQFTLLINTNPPFRGRSPFSLG